MEKFESMDIAGFQRKIRDIYLERDSARGAEGTFRWLVEEVGELARAMRNGERGNLEEEFGDVLAWLVSLASIYDIDMEKAASKYAEGCPKCGGTPCVCK